MGANPYSFYVTLFSNSSMNAYHNNAIAAFTVQLAHGIDLGTHRWQVALCEFSCPPPTIKPHLLAGY